MVKTPRLYVECSVDLSVTASPDVWLAKIRTMRRITYTYKVQQVETRAQVEDKDT